MKKRKEKLTHQGRPDRTRTNSHWHASALFFFRLWAFQQLGRIVVGLRMRAHVHAPELARLHRRSAYPQRIQYGFDRRPPSRSVNQNGVRHHKTTRQGPVANAKVSLFCFF